MVHNWQPRPLTELGDFTGQAILLICEYGAYEGGLKGFSENYINIETGPGEVIAIERDVLENDLTELYVIEQ